MKRITDITDIETVDQLWNKHLKESGPTLSPEALKVSNGIYHYLFFLKWTADKEKCPISSAKFIPMHKREFHENEEAVNAWLNKTPLGIASANYRDDLTVQFAMTGSLGTTLANLNKVSYSVWLVARLNKDLEWQVDYADLIKVASEDSILIRDLSEEVLLRQTVCNLIKIWDCQVRGVSY